MNHIVLDLEYNQMGLANDDCPFEIIEMGAVKLNEDFDIIDTFRVFVKPNIYKIVNYKIKTKTGITNKDLEFGLSFERCIKEFKNWLGEESSIYTWSDNDFKIMAMNCNYYNVGFEWFYEYTDIQVEYKMFKNDANIKSLKKVIAELNIPYVENAHTALADAKYTAQILRYMRGKEILQYKEKEPKVLINSEDYKIIQCPICDKLVKTLYSSKGFNKKKRYNALSRCEDCHCKILHTVTKEVINNEEIKYILNTTVTDNGTYESLKTQFV